MPASRQSLRLSLFLFVLALLMFGLRLGLGSLYDWDEAWYGQVVKEMLRSGDWVTLQWRGAPFFDKPPLAIWAIALSFKLFGASEWAARLPSALCASACVPALFWIGGMVFERQRAALLSALVLLTSLPFVKAGRMAMLDAPLALAFTLGIGAFVASKRNPRWAIGFGLALAAVWMIKGPLAILLTLICLGFALWERKAYAWSSPWLLLGIALGAACVAPWYAAQWTRYGMEFVQNHLGVHVLGRASSAMDGHRGGPWFYLVQLAAQLHPWFFALVPAALYAWRRRESTAIRLAVCWGGGVFVAFSLAATKLPWYVVPMYPGLALLIGGYLDHLLARKVPARALGRAWQGLGTLLLIAGIPYLLLSPTPGDRGYVFGVAVLGLGLLLGGARLSGPRFQQGPWLVVASAYLAFLALIPANLQWETRFSPDLHPFAAVAAEHVPATRGINYLGATTRPSFVYYLDRSERLVTADVLAAAWAPGETALLREDEWAALAPRLAGAQVSASASGMVFVTAPVASESVER
ncbi:glycosyltransferase family 39 protein [bacterium]|nr:glycosyltransferase family 39 protein [bacterium]